MLTRYITSSLNKHVRHVVYVPKHKPPEQRDFEALRDFINRHEKILVLTGAGISTESGEYNVVNT